MDPTITRLSLGWRAVVAMEGMTDDGRGFGALDWRALPLSLSTQTVTAYEHLGGFISGRIDTLEKYGSVVVGTGVFNDDEDGLRAAELLANGSLRGVSMDALGQGQFVCSEYETIEDPWGVYEMCTDGIFYYPEATILGMHQVATPAFAATLMEPIPDGETEEDAAAAVKLMVAAAETLYVPVPDLPNLPTAQAEGYTAALRALLASIAVPDELSPPVKPPAAWFEAPEPDWIVPLHIRDDGSVQGHIAAWGECHLGIQDVCTIAPHSATDYRYYHLGMLITEEGDEVRVGQVTLGTGHADLHVGVRSAMAHYDDTGCAVADIVVRDGKHGIWACGAARPGITPEQVREFNATGPSGDWRPIPGSGLELVAVLQVNVPGFPLVASAVDLVEVVDTEKRVSSVRPEQGALVAGLGPRHVAAQGLTALRAERKARLALEARVTKVERMLTLLVDRQADQLVNDLIAEIQ